MNNISDHITYSEATKSQVAVRNKLKNDPGPLELENMQRVAVKVFEKVRSHFGVPIAITSFFRSRTVNSLVGGSSSSQHCKGEAMDIDAQVFGGLKNSDLFTYIRRNCEFDQLIWEFGDENEPAWVHVSYKSEGNRKQVLKAFTVNSKAVYQNFN